MEELCNIYIDKMIKTPEMFNVRVQPGSFGGAVEGQPEWFEFEL